MKRLLQITALGTLALASPIWAASDLLKNIEAHYKQTEHLQADFIQSTYIELLDREKVRKGKLSLSRNRFRVTYVKPEKQEYIYNGKTLWIYSPEHKEVEIYEEANAQLSREALSFLSGLGTLRDSFTVKIKSETKQQSQLELTPKSKTSRFRQLELTLDPESYLIKEVTLWPKQGNRSHYLFNHFQEKQELAAKIFEFKIPKKVTALRPLSQ
jgi:chaperone LolA